MKNLINKIGLAAFMAVLAIPLVGPLVAKAAADADLAAGFASSTAFWTDNKGAIIGYGVGVVIAATLVALAIKAMFFAKNQALGTLKTGRGRRR